MAFESEKSNVEHSLTLVARKDLKIHGVNQIICFDDTSVVLSSSQGEIEISGNALNVDALDLEKGYAAVSGEISGINYIDELPKKKKRFWS